MASFLLSPSSNSGSGRNSNKRQLIRPTAHIPWSVDVVSAVPGPVFEMLDSALAGATHQKWACLVFPKGIVYVWQTQQTSNLGEPLQRPKEFVKLFFPDIQVDEKDASRAAPLVALSSPRKEDRDSVHLYVLHPTTGWLVLRKITRRDLRTNISGTYSARVRIPINDSSSSSDGSDDDDDNDNGISDEESILSLTCHRSMIVAGTSKGYLYWITHIAVPVGLHVQKVEAPDTASLLSRASGYLFGSAGRKSISTELPSSAPADTIILPLSRESEFLAVSTVSGIVRWTAEQPIASGHHAIFSSESLGTFAESIARSSSDSDWILQEILKATVSADCRFLHCIVRGLVSESGESRLYWIVVRLDGGRNDGDGNEETIAMTIVRSHWLSRFALPDQVSVLGLVSCENDSIYVALSAVNDAVIVMALIPGGGDDINCIIQEVDLPMREIPNLLPSMMERDNVTHGCYMVASSGIGMRARYMPQQNQLQSPSKRRRLGNDKVLMQHLRSHFWTSYQNPNIDKPPPPSLLQADAADFEQAVVQIGAELQQKGAPSTHSISLEWHQSFIKLLQDDGLYRHLSDDSKWSLLGIGQELKVFGEIAQFLLNQHKHSQEQEVVDLWQRDLQPQSIADWFLSVQKYEDESGWLHSNLWYDLLGIALDSLLEFRQEFAQHVYDVATEVSPKPLWISHPSMREMLKCQIKYWEKNYQDVPLSLIEAVVKTALLSYSESLSPSLASNESSRIRIEFVKIQKAGISLLRSLGRDELAFELCVQYRHFDGLCELSVDHEKKRDARSYSLDPLFDTMKGKDSRSGWSFAQHVLQWHTDRGLYGQVINYGRHSIGDLNQIMDKNTQLRQFRWIPIIRQGFFGKATATFLENCEESNSLHKSQWALSMAKLTNKLSPIQSQQTKEQHHSIEMKLELVDAQRMLIDKPGKDCPILSPDELIELAIKKLGECYDEDDQLRLAFIGLTICKFLDDKQASMEQTSRIWAECLLANAARWTEWALEGAGSSSEDLASLREEAMSSTVFGRLLEECRKDDDMREVTYGRDIESVVIDRVQGDDNRESFTRVLRSVAAPVSTETIQADSLMVSTF
eukprot:CAMPEP_0197180364 /NCGR_PEP_ID=MMETSP1423-20130617/5005_1 /TAXON_ID=476441 /ORGANISM="Pseudo-nitzschia heimii, Strain UNC1101" /LENGTH=1088 /DNA_ID=CAMNT_0042630435 /DNA_START=171 /DNA_END=3437 /DNA_ORIENTATION=-